MKNFNFIYRNKLFASTLAVIFLRRYCTIYSESNAVGKYVSKTAGQNNRLTQIQLHQNDRLNDLTFLLSSCTLLAGSKEEK